MNHKITDYFSKKMNTQIKESQTFSNLLSLPHHNLKLWEHQSKIIKKLTSSNISENDLFENLEKLVFYGRKESFRGLLGLKAYFLNLNFENRTNFITKILPFMASKALDVKIFTKRTQQ